MCKDSGERSSVLGPSCCVINFTFPQSYYIGASLQFHLLIFLVDEGTDDPNVSKSRPSLARQRNADNGPTLNAGLLAM